jgi:TPR repeat protein
MGHVVSDLLLNVLRQLRGTPDCAALFFAFLKEESCPIAMYVAFRLSHLHGMPVSREATFSTAQKAAEKLAAARGSLAECHLFGLGCDVDDDKALSEACVGASLGDPWSKALLYIQTRKVRHLREAAEMGLLVAQGEYADLLERNGDSESVYWRGRMLERLGDRTRMAEYGLSASRNWASGDAVARYWVGRSAVETYELAKHQLPGAHHWLARAFQFYDEATGRVEEAVLTMALIGRQMQLPSEVREQLLRAIWNTRIDELWIEPLR